MAAAHWTEDLFLRHPEVFLAVHENAWSKGEEQARDLNAILERFGVPAGGRILDAPCGIGRHATRLAKMGYRTVGVDLSGVRRARDRTRAPTGRGRSRDVSHRRPPPAHRSGPRNRRAIRRGPEPLDVPRVLR